MTSLCMREYGIDFSSGLQAVRQWDRSLLPRIRTYATDRVYTVAVRRVARASGSGYEAQDGRLLAAGWCWMSPQRFHAVLPSFLAYWSRAVSRPHIVGSSHNVTTPDVALAAMFIGIPARALQVPGVCSIAETVLRVRRVSSAAVWPRRISARRRRKLLRVARAASRTSASFVPCGYTLGMDAWAALGRVSPELQRAVLWSVQFLPKGLIRSRDLPWSVARQRCSGDRARVAWATGRRQNSLILQSSTSCSRALTVRGIPPVEFAHYALRREGLDGDFTHAEASAWMADGQPLIWEWLRARVLAHAPLPAHASSALYGLVYSARSLHVLRWVASVARRPAQWSALIAYRPVPPAVARHVPEGTKYQLAAKVDEVLDEDIPTLSAGPVAVLERAARRWARVQEEQLISDATPFRAVSAWRDGVVTLAGSTLTVAVVRTPADLVQLGRTQSNCVGNYVSLMKAGASVIVTITGLTVSTAEIDPRRMAVVQHSAEANTTPPWLVGHRQALDAWLKTGPVAGEAADAKSHTKLDFIPA